MKDDIAEARLSSPAPTPPCPLAAQPRSQHSSWPQEVLPAEPPEQRPAAQWGMGSGREEARGFVRGLLDDAAVPRGQGSQGGALTFRSGLSELEEHGAPFGQNW